MNIIKDNPEDIKAQFLESKTACIGTFDGMHLGHQELLLNTKKVGNGAYSVVTFSELPQITLQSADFKLITSNKQKEKIFSSFDTTNLIYLDFSCIRNYTPHNFCELLANKYNINEIVIGDDFKFGKDRKGDASFLRKYFGNDNVVTVPTKLINKEKVSSTKIRELLYKGQVESASKLLGRPYNLEAKVVKGDGFGKELGFPTANLEIEKHILPRVGVYAVRVYIQNLREDLIGMMNIGYRPTVSSNDELRVEVNIFDFNFDIYGTNLSLEIISLLREEKRFNGIDELKTQLLKDKQNSINKLKS
tara:strand:+ start:3367 stop:4281 length:915 start_codon:yes stop_codon:yes gene_type:complete